jgi:hypothetical protein
VKTYPMALALRIALLLSWPLQSPISSQIAPPLGRLHITSTPEKWNITINDKLRPEHTNVTLVVSPAVYKVLVNGGPGNLSCPVLSCQVSAGATVEIACPLPPTGPGPNCHAFQ